MASVDSNVGRKLPGWTRTRRRVCVVGILETFMLREGTGQSF